MLVKAYSLSSHENRNVFMAEKNKTKRHLLGINNLVFIHRLAGQSEDTEAAFMQTWMTSHWRDSRSILKKPLVLAEFGKSSKDSGYNQNVDVIVEATAEEHNITIDNPSTASKEEEKIEPISLGE
ncbi:Mannan endo-1,4-beta-mannosidase 5 [Capsicum chinense]|nr:Mannan endo-1,4-beta-mannosidase 5 [Capsicum chinense]